jgi:hypothetical protein
MPLPFPTKRKFLRSAAVPCSSRGNQGSGTTRVRLSARSTVKELSVTLTLAAVNALSSGSEKLHTMPSATVTDTTRYCKVWDRHAGRRKPDTTNMRGMTVPKLNLFEKSPNPVGEFHAGFNPLLPLWAFFFGTGVERAGRGGWLSMAARKIRLMRV